MSMLLAFNALNGVTHGGVCPEYASRTEAGWSGILDGLAAALG